jgi:hypothetical protein
MKSGVQVLRIVVASPGDVARERDLVEQIVQELNRTTAADRRLLLQVNRWETDSYPGLHLGGPQGICDAVLRIEDCDVLVGIFWTRIGTLKKEQDETSTQHEIKGAISEWSKRGSPDVMLFFNNAPPRLRSASERRQWMLLAEYREQLSGEGLLWDYEGAENFEKEFRRCFENYLRQKVALTVVDPDAAADLIAGRDELKTARVGIAEQGLITVRIGPRVSPEKVEILFRALASFYRDSDGSSLQVIVDRQTNGNEDA